MESFDTLTEALEHVAEHFIPNKRCYIVDVLASGEDVTALQIVAEHMVTAGGSSGLTLYLPFDTTCGEFLHLSRFVDKSLDRKFMKGESAGVEYFWRTIGTDIVETESVTRYLLLHVYGHENLAGFRYEVYDEGPIVK